MVLILNNVLSWYKYIFDDLADPRVMNWPLMSSPFPTILICLSYVYLVKNLGPRIMENRKPFELRKTIIAYNVIQVYISSYIFLEALRAGWGWGRYNFGCVPVDFSENGLREANGCYLYFLSKFSEFFDTIFFVLRKKNNQVSTLHVIHHGIMPFSVWWGVKYSGGGQATFFGLLNTFVHIIMYTYYLLAAFGDAMKPYLWWKKHLTTIQMIQFVLIVLHSLNLLRLGCDGSKAILIFIMIHAVLFLILFYQFYSQSYSKKGLKSSHVIKTDEKLATTIDNGKSKMVYAHVDDSLPKGYTSGFSNGLKNRAFVQSKEENS